MRRSRFFKYFPTPEKIRNSRLLRPFGRHLQHHFLWQFNRQSVALGAAVGLFFGILMPFGQIPVSALFAIIARANLPVAALGTFISNPLTFAPMYYIAYRLGNFLLGATPSGADGSGGGEAMLGEKVNELITRRSRADIQGLLDNLADWAVGVGPALSFGLLVLATITALIAYLAISGLWRLYVLRRWRRRSGYQPFRVRSWERRTLLPRQLAMAIGMVAFLAVAAVDVATGVNVSLLPVHLVPTLFVGWFVGIRWGIGFAIAALVVQVLIGREAGLHQDVMWQIDRGMDFLVVLLLLGMQARLKQLREDGLRQAKHDSLTGTLNRSGFYAALDREIERAKRYGHPFSLIYFDCSNFRQVNDTLGHHAGDRLLKRVARELQENMRKIDAIGRLSGDEFAILLSESDTDATCRTAYHLKEKMAALMEKEQWPLSFNMGAASFTTPPDNIEAVLDSADKLMVRVRQTDRDAVACEVF